MATENLIIVQLHRKKSENWIQLKLKLSFTKIESLLTFSAAIQVLKILTFVFVAFVFKTSESKTRPSCKFRTNLRIT